jgi:NDP-sugar pyrophosphorylase family protein
MKALILAAGLGTRLKPITNHIPKALVTIDGKTLLEHQILKLKSAGFNEIIVNVHHFADQIIEFLQTKNNFNIRIEISDERDCLLDTGGAIRKAAWFFDDGKPFLVHNVDIFPMLI